MFHNFSRNLTITLLSVNAQYVDAIFNETFGDSTEATSAHAHDVFALMLASLAIISNVLSLVAVCNIRINLNTPYRLIISLAASDILISSSVMLNIIINKLTDDYVGVEQESEGNNKQVFDCLYVFNKALNTTGLNVSLLNLMAMAVDHYIAILHPLYNRTFSRSCRTHVFVGGIWVVATVCGFSDFLSGISKYSSFQRRYNYCDFVYQTRYQEEFTVFGIAFLTLSAMCVIYPRVIVTIQRVQRKKLGQRKRILPAFKVKAVITSLLIVGTFMLCWLPQCLFQIVMIIQVRIDPESTWTMLHAYLTADQYLYNLLILNCILDPVIYAVRMRPVQMSYRRMFTRCCKIQDDLNDDPFSSFRSSSARRRSRLNSSASITRLGT